MKLKLKKSIFFVNSSPEAIVHLVQKALFTHKIKLYRILWQQAEIRCQWISQSNSSIGHLLRFVIGRLNTLVLLYKIAPCLNTRISLAFLCVKSTRQVNVLGRFLVSIPILTSFVNVWIHCTSQGNCVSHSCRLFWQFFYILS